MTNRTSVAMTADTHRELWSHLVRADGQEDVCLGTYRTSTGATRRTALIRKVILPEPGERDVHGNASITGDYVLRALAIAQGRDEGLALCHSHPRGRGWQSMSGPDRDAESAYANLCRELTGLPLVGMTLAGDGQWSARHWDFGTGTDVDATACENVRVVGDHLALSWNDALVLPPRPQASHVRSVACWGAGRHADLTRRSVLVVGAGSVGLDVLTRLAATGVTTIGVMDFDTVEYRNLDRLIGVTAADAWLRRSKAAVARRLLQENATAAHPSIKVSEYSICEPVGLGLALDFDIVFSCVDRPWARAVLNAMAYRDLIPVIDGGIAIDVFPDGDGMRGATWRSHVVRPGRPCMSCTGQLDLGAVAADRDGSRDDSEYIGGHGLRVPSDGGQNVAALSISSAGSLLGQYVSLNIAPGGLGEPGPLQYILSTHSLHHLNVMTRPGFARSRR
jgi:molybdopterin-synthase adenylyltransferase